MSQVMVGPDGTEHEFPDGTPVPVMQRAVRAAGDAQAASAQKTQEQIAGGSHYLQDTAATAVEGVKGFGRALASPLTMLLHPQDAYSGVKAMGAAGLEAIEHPSEIGPAYLQGLADPEVMGNAAGGLGALLAAPKIPAMVRGAGRMMPSVSGALESTAGALETASQVKHPTLSGAAKGLRYAAGKLSGDAPPSIDPTLTGEMPKTSYRPKLTGKGTMTPDTGPTEVPTRMDPRLVKAQPLEGHMNDALSSLRNVATEPTPALSLEIEHHIAGEPNQTANVRVSKGTALDPAAQQAILQRSTAPTTELPDSWKAFATQPQETAPSSLAALQTEASGPTPLDPANLPEVPPFDVVDDTEPQTHVSGAQFSDPWTGEMLDATAKRFGWLPYKEPR